MAKTGPYDQHGKSVAAIQYRYVMRLQARIKELESRLAVVEKQREEALAALVRLRGEIENLVQPLNELKLNQEEHP